MLTVETMPICVEQISVDEWTSAVFKKNHLEVEVLRLDKIHPVISGNKWFKLKYHLAEALDGKYTTLVTWGGAYSNHIVATAFAARSAGLRSVGIVRGERAMHLSHTLQSCETLGMELHFIPRDAYAKKDDPASLAGMTKKFPAAYFIPEGGSGEKGIRGSMEILSTIQLQQYTHLACAVGTGTMYRGLVNAAFSGQQVIGIAVLKGMRDLLIDGMISHDYHFGGYAKRTDELIAFMNALYLESGIPVDFVYNAKLFYAVKDLANKNHFPPGSRILIIHSGGLQGNLSLLPRTLNF